MKVIQLKRADFKFWKRKLDLLEPGPQPVRLDSPEFATENNHPLQAVRIAATSSAAEAAATVAAVTDATRRPERETALQEQINALAYLEHMAASTSTDISEWNIIELFAEDDLIPTDRNVLNEKFLEARSEARRGPQLSQDELIAETKKQLKNFDSSWIHERKASINAEISHYRESIQTYQRRLTETSRQMRNQMEQLEHLTSSTKLEDEIDKIAQNQFWEIERMASGSLYLRTRGSCVLRYRGETVDFGRFRIKIYLKTGGIVALPLENNIHYKFQYYHPHINENGGLCWGDAAGAVSEQFGMGNIAEILDLLQALLTTYNNDNPYMAFESFEVHGARLRKVEKFPAVRTDQTEARNRGEDTSVYPSILIPPSPESASSTSPFVNVHDINQFNRLVEEGEAEMAATGLPSPDDDDDDDWNDPDDYEEEYDEDEAEEPVRY